MVLINSNKLFKIFVTVGLIVLLIYWAQKINHWYKLPKIIVSKELSAINLKSNYANLMSLGHSRLISSILWITTLIEGDIEHYKGSGNSWMFHRFLTISKLEPKFYQNYLYGGQYLSIVKDDIFGANTLYSLGTDLYPDDFRLNYNAGFNAAFEIGDSSLALKYYNRIYDNPVVQSKYPSLLSVINKLRLDSGSINLEQIYELYLISWQGAKDDGVKRLLAGYLYNIKAEIDLNCLNQRQATSKCSLHDFLGNKYFRNDNNKWSAVKDWSPYRLKRKTPRK